MPLQQTSGNSTTDAYAGGVALVPNYIEDVFSTYLYTGNGSTQTITNGIDLAGKGGLVWVKDRTTTGNYNLLFDTARGVSGGYLTSNTPSAQTGTFFLSSFNSNGFSGSGGADFNQSGDAFASWTFRKQPKFFDVVTWTGDGTGNRQIAHALGSVPGCIIVKRLDAATNWPTYHQSLGNTKSLFLNLTAASTTTPLYWNNTTPTSANFTVGSDTDVNNSGGTYVAYIFAHNAGGFGLTGTDNVISCGSFTTDGSGNATVSLGYEPQWLLYKRTDSTGAWRMNDIMRGASLSGTTATLYSNYADAETTPAYGAYPTATGFQTYGNIGSSASFIYIAIRRGPMKVPTDATKVFTPQIATASDTVSNTVTTNFPVDLSINQYRNANYPTWMDRLRGDSKTNYVKLTSAATTAEATGTNGLGFDNNTGYVDNYNWYNIGAGPVVYWNFRRAPGFFDEVCYTGTGTAGQTFNHNLAVVPELMIIKDRSTASFWTVYASSIGNTKFLFLNDTMAAATNSIIWNNTSPTSSVFSVGTGSGVNSSAHPYVAYLFATCAGVSKVGSYTGNGTTQTINCGFAGGARFVFIKRTDSTGDWYVYDTARGMTTLTDPYLLLNSTAAESATLGSVTTVTTGFALNEAILTGINTSAATYIYLSIA